jgi:hypothetical protein
VQVSDVCVFCGSFSCFNVVGNLIIIIHKMNAIPQLRLVIFDDVGRGMCMAEPRWQSAFCVSAALPFFAAAW